MPHKLNAVMLCTALLVGCASASLPVAYKYDSRFSEARNLMEAAHIGGLRDLPYKRYREAREAAQNKGINLDTGPTLAGGAAFGALNFISPPPGFSSAGAGLAGFASWLLIDTTHPGTNSHIFAWMPVDEASSPEQAKMKLYGIFKDALAGAIQDTSWPKDYSVNLKERSETSAKDSFVGELEVVITGGDCDKKFMRCGYRGFRTPLPRTEMAPDFLGGGHAYVWRWPVETRYWAIVPEKSKTKVSRQGTTVDWYAGFPDIDFYKAFTRQVPRWVYVYLAPQSWSHGVDGKYALPQYPIVINQGRVLYFIAPAPAAATR